uniref:protein-tyrosine-phosphatase n=2 Tax=Guillardia theta TaxID=55529 RepID=A0A7S4PI06_GUITH|mmetsp:Transcript_51133/g.159739  ORF Transcript_51133/g.159739 Transcript_51133/m.159739 type:complete len:872 (+) Transcript_51133:101-2716(+)
MPVTKSGLPEALRNMISSVKSSKGTISKEEVEERRKALAHDTDGMMKARKRLNSLPDSPSEYPGMSNSQLSKATSEILDSMSPKTRNQCVARMKARAFNAGEVIIEEGAIGTSMYFIDVGHAIAVKNGKVLQSLASGDYFGEICFIATVTNFLERSGVRTDTRQMEKCVGCGIYRVASIQATEDCRCLELNVKDFMVVIQEDPAGLRAILGILSQVASRRSERAKSCTAQSAENEPVQRSSRDDLLIHRSASSELGVVRLPATSPEPSNTKGPRTSSESPTRFRPEFNQPGHSGRHACDMDLHKKGSSTPSKVPASVNPADNPFLHKYLKSKASCDLFDNLSERSRFHCFQAMNLVKFKAGECIVKKGSLGTTMYFIDYGKVNAVVEGKVAQSLESGDFFGEMSFLATCRKRIKESSETDSTHLRACDVVAQIDAGCWELTVEDFLNSLNSDLAGNREALRVLAKCAEKRRANIHRLESAKPGEPEPEPPAHIAARSKPAPETMEEIEYGVIHPLLPNRLSFTIHKDQGQTKVEIVKNRKLFFFSSTFHESYVPYCDDFGPVNLAAVYEFCKYMQEKLQDPRLANRQLVYYAERDVALRTNAAFLLGTYLIVVEQWTPEEAALAFASMGKRLFVPFRDATYQPPTFHLSLLDCLRGLKAAMTAGLFDYESFDVNRYLFLDNPAQYDLHQPCPKFIAFRGPDSQDARMLRPEAYSQIFHTLKVSAVVRLNEASTYDAEEFKKNGIRHYDMEFEDCTTPPAKLVDRFLSLCTSEKGVVAVHCKAGLGRTGTLIALWMMRKYQWTARDCIAWLRIVRPGSIIGVQQQYLVACEESMKKGAKLPEPEEVEKLLAGGSASKMAKQVELGMLNRRDR